MSCPRCNNTGSYIPDWTYESRIKCTLCECSMCRGVGYIPITEGAPAETCGSCLGLGRIKDEIIEVMCSSCHKLKEYNVYPCPTCESIRQS